MKFGKRLGAEAGRGWQHAFLDYKACKRAISKDAILEDPQGRAFETVLRAELRKINAFFTEKEEELEAVMRNIERQAGMLTAVRTEVLTLRKFSILNATAVIKAVKKRNKHLGKVVGTALQKVCATQVLSHQHFFTSSHPANLLTQAEILSQGLNSVEDATKALEDWECPICLAVLENPVTLSCAHRFCWGCLLAHCATCQDASTEPHEEGDKEGKPRDRLLNAMLGPSRVINTYPCPVCRKAHPLDLDRLQVDSKLAAFIADLKKRQLEPSRTSDVPPPNLAGSATSVTVLDSVKVTLKPESVTEKESAKSETKIATYLDNQKSTVDVLETEVEKEESENSPQPPLLPPQAEGMKGRLTVVLDLDGTLISSFAPRRAPSFSKSCNSYIVGKGAKLNPNGVLVVERPELKQFLEELYKFAEVVVFTAGLEDYASPICGKLQARYGEFQATLYRPATVAAKEYPCVKDLSLLGRDLNKTVLVDDTPLAFLHQPDNGIPIFSFRGDEDDRVLPEAILPLLQQLETCEDVRPVLHKRFNMPHWLSTHGICVPSRPAPWKPPRPPKSPGTALKQNGTNASPQSDSAMTDKISDTLILSDFDKTLTDCDAGERLIGELAPELVPMLASLQQPANFVPLTNAVLREIARRGVTPEKMNEVLSKMGSEIPSASKSLLEWAKEQQVDVRIISDCNTHFIGKMLEGAGLKSLVKQVITNSSELESSMRSDSARDLTIIGQSKSGRQVREEESSQFLAIKPCYDHENEGSHSCPICPSNLCKGMELRKLREQRPYKKIIYLGDGANDLCPSLQLREDDLVFARRGYDLAKLIQARKSELKARVYQWNTHNELFEMLRNIA